MRKFYTLLAVLGIILPYYAMLSSILIDQYSVNQFFSAWFDNNAVKMIAADLGVAGTTFSAFIIFKYKNGQGPHPLKYFLMMLGVGLSLAMPMYFLNTLKN
tara:strand:+ start:304 stop:606 length:303 start_codon:yes stop_codon:yes gene_type:complete